MKSKWRSIRWSISPIFRGGILTVLISEERRGKIIVIHLKNELVRTIMIAEMILGAIQLRDMEMIIYLLQRWRKKLKPAAIGENLLYHTIIIIGGKLHLVPMKFGMQVMPECIMFRSRQVLGIIL